MRLVVLSDTHTRHRQLDVPYGDVVIHAGDSCVDGTQEELLSFLDWFEGLPHRHRIIIGGNHDGMLESAVWRDLVLRNYRWTSEGGFLYLEGAAALEVNGETLRVYGAPWRPRPDSWTPGAPMRPGKRTSAFGVRESEIASRWAEIPEGLDVLVTHVPPHGVLDEIQTPAGPIRIGCPALAARLAGMARPPRLHVFGHAHDQGAQTVQLLGRQACNAAVCDGEYRVVGKPQVFKL